MPMRGFVLVFILLVTFFQGDAQNRNNFTSQGRYELSKGRYVSAMNLFNRALQLSPFNSEAVFLRGIVKYELEDFVGAEKDFTKTIELNPKNHEAFLYRGVCRSQLLKYKLAFEDYNQAIKLDDKDWRPYSNRALASLLLDRYVDAISDCNKIIDLKKESSQTYLLRGEAKSGLEMYKVAIEDFERAIKLDSLAMRPVLHRGIAKGKLELFEDALADFELAMLLDTSTALPVFHRGTVKAEMGLIDEALSDFNLVLHQYPNNSVALFNRAMAYTKKGLSKKALEDYNSVVKQSPNSVLGYFNRAILKHNDKRYTEALDDYNRAIELFPEFLDAHENRLDVLQRLGRRDAYNEAVLEFEKIRSSIAISDEDAKIDQHVKLMKATELKGDFESAPQEVGKIQHKKVEVRLLPFYVLSGFPETDKDILVYDGFNRPNYKDVGVLAFVVEGEQDYSGKRISGVVNELDADNRSTMVRLAMLNTFMGDYPISREQLNGFIEVDKNQVIGYLARAIVAQLELNQLENEHAEMVGMLDLVDSVHQAKTEQLMAAAEKDYRKVIELDPEMSFAHFNYGHLLANTERYEEAATQFGLAASSAGNFIEANYNRGLIRILLGEIDKGCEDMSLAGELGLTDAYNVIKRYCE